MLGGLFGVFSKNHLARDLYIGVDYHSHLGTEIGGLAYLDGDIKIVCRDISNSQFKSEMQKEYRKIQGQLGIGVISDSEDEQPLRFESKIGTFALCTIGVIKNLDTLYNEMINKGITTFKKSRVKAGVTIPNQTEIVGEIISKGKNIVDGIETVYEKIEGTISLLLLCQNEKSIYASGDTFPLVLGNRGNDWAIASETTSFSNLRYKVIKFIEHREIISISETGVKTRIKLSAKKRFCPFLLVYFGFPTSDYYGINAEIVRERCGGLLAEEDKVEADLVLGIADSGFPHAVGYVKRKSEIAKEKIFEALNQFKQGKIDLCYLEETVKKALDSITPLRRPLVKYTPGWGRSYIPPTQERREQIARYKQVPNPQMIQDKKIILIDDSIRRGTQLKDLLREKIMPYNPKEVHGRIASPPQMYPCVYDLSTKIKELATWKSMNKVEENPSKCTDSKSQEYKTMVEEIRKNIGFTTLEFQTIENFVRAIIEAPNNKDLRKEDLCLYCWTGET